MENSLSLAYVSKIFAGVTRQGVSLEDLLVARALDPDLLSQPRARLGQRVFAELLQEAMQRTGDEFLGLGHSTRSRPGTFAMMAHAVIHCRNLGKAIERSAAFYAMFDWPGGMHLQRQDELAIFQIEMPVTAHRDVMIEAVMFLALRFWSWLLGQEVKARALDFDFAAPQEAGEFAVLFDCPLHFAAARNAIVLDAALLDRPLLQTPQTLSHFLRNSLSTLIEGAGPPPDIVQQLRALLRHAEVNRLPEFAEVSRGLGLSESTLRRLLREAGSSFQQVRDDWRKHTAIFYLRRPDLGLQEISTLMGFSEVSAFHRAFRRWTGMPPGAFRQQDGEKLQAL